MKDSLEREVKLRAEAGFRLPQLRGMPIQPRHFSSTYHDTLDHRLAAIGVTLRYRAENGAGTWQLELPNRSGRVELELPGTPDVVPLRFRDLVAGALRTRPIAEVATLDTLRRGVRVQRSGRMIADVTVDQVVVRAGDAAIRAFDELEVELIDGDGRDLRKLAAKLREAGAEPGDQHPKLLRALGLDRIERPRVNPKDSPRRQLATMLRIQYLEIVGHDCGTRLGRDPEELHQHRVAVRRMRALLRAARPMLDRTWVEDIRAELRWLGAVLGEVRDLDVLIERLEYEATLLEADDARAFGRLLGILANRREAARALMLAELREPRYTTLLDRLEHEVGDPPPAGRPMKLRRIAGAEFRRLRRAYRSLDDDPADEELHDLRIHCKRARYAAELAAPRRGKPARRFISATKRLQDVLGEHQDATVAAAQLRDLAFATADARAAVAAGIVVERQRQRKDDARSDLPDAWRDVRRRGKRAWS